MKITKRKLVGFSKTMEDIQIEVTNTLSETSKVFSDLDFKLLNSGKLRATEMIVYFNNTHHLIKLEPKTLRGVNWETAGDLVRLITEYVPVERTGGTQTPETDGAPA